MIRFQRFRVCAILANSLFILCMVQLSAGQGRGASNGLEPAQSLTIFDGRGKRVGNVLALHQQGPVVGFKIQGELVLLTVEQGKLGGGYLTAEYSSLYFESDNCTGTPFVPLSLGSSVSPVHLLDGSKLYSFEAPKAVIIRSQGSTSAPNVPCSPTSTQGTMPALRLLIDLKSEFNPPFTMR